MMDNVPFVTKTLMGINILVHVLIFLTTANLGSFVINAQWVWNKGEYYRIVTSAFTHSGILHIAMNMSSLYQLGSSLEVQFGSLPFLLLSLWSVFLIGFLYVAISFLLYFFTDDFSYLISSGVGYSGVLFCYAILESYHTPVESRSLFGFCTVPSKMYPFILLVGISVLIPGISFLGHFSGVVVGLLATYGWLDFAFLPSLQFCEHVEAAGTLGLSLCMRQSGYVRSSGISRTFALPTAGNSSGGVCGAVCTGLCLVLDYVKNFLQTLAHVIGCGTSCDSLLASISSLYRRAEGAVSSTWQARTSGTGTGAATMVGGVISSRSPGSSGSGGSSPGSGGGDLEGGRGGSGLVLGGARGGYSRLTQTDEDRREARSKAAYEAEMNNANASAKSKSSNLSKGTAKERKETELKSQSQVKITKL